MYMDYEYDYPEKNLIPMLLLQVVQITFRNDTFEVSLDNSQQKQGSTIDLIMLLKA